MKECPSGKYCSLGKKNVGFPPILTSISLFVSNKMMSGLLLKVYGIIVFSNVIDCSANYTELITILDTLTCLDNLFLYALRVFLVYMVIDEFKSV